MNSRSTGAWERRCYGNYRRLRRDRLRIGAAVCPRQIRPHPGRSEQSKLKAVADQLEREHGIRVRVLPTDLSRPLAPVELVSELDSESVRIDVLVNNAGFGVHGLFTENSLVDQLEMVPQRPPTVISPGVARVAANPARRCAQSISRLVSTPLTDRPADRRRP
jgi:NAD(P)-dependent dehydrogenase (short-subunit alcohol dehydrogenase family)